MPPRAMAGRGTCAAGRRPSPFLAPSPPPLALPSQHLTRPELARPHAMQEPYYCIILKYI